MKLVPSVNKWLSIRGRNPSQLKHKVVINVQSSTQDSFGQPVLTWTPVRTSWGGLNIITMKEAFGEGQLTALETDIWTVRWSAIEIQPGMQLTFFAGLTWKVQAVSNVLRRNLIVHLLCLQLNTGS